MAIVLLWVCDGAKCVAWYSCGAMGVRWGRGEVRRVPLGVANGTKII